MYNIDAERYFRNLHSERMNSMRINYTSRKMSLREPLKEHTEKKLKKLERFFGDDSSANVVFSLEKENTCKAEITIEYNGIIFRAQSTAPEFTLAIDNDVDMLIRQIRKHRTKLEKKLKTQIPQFEEYEDEVAEDDDIIIRRKKLDLKPMPPEEAVLQMNMLGHDFFAFCDDDGKPFIVYKRRKGDYGLIEMVSE